MAFPVVKQCCCGCSLETGSKIIAWLQIIAGQFLILAGIAVAQKGDSSNRGGGAIVGGILNIVFGAVLLKGIQKKQSDKICAWIIISLIEIILHLIGVVLGAIICAAILGFREEFFIAVIAVIINLIFIALNFYYLVVVSSLRKEIVAARNIVV